jgi:hypothetical protein
MVDALLSLDANGRPFEGLLPFRAVKRITFAGGTANAIGDHDGDLDPFPVFNVTGDVLAVVVGICKTDLVGAGTLELGIPGATASLLAQIADATTLDANEAWVDATPSLGEGFTPAPKVIGGGLDIIGTVGSTNITAGVIDFYCFWMPLSDDGQVSPA